MKHKKLKTLLKYLSRFVSLLLFGVINICLLHFRIDAVLLYITFVIISKLLWRSYVTNKVKREPPKSSGKTTRCFSFVAFLCFGIFGNSCNKITSADDNEKEDEFWDLIINYFWLAILKLICMALSPDFVLSDFCKDWIKNKENDKISQEARARFIKRQNCWNFLLSLSLFITLAIFMKKGWECDFLKILILIRLVSRTMEINLAFFADVVSDPTEKESSLKREDRIKLALVSFLEEIILFFAFYSIIAGKVNHEVFKEAFSFLFNIDDPPDICPHEKILLRFAFAYQKLCTFVIITLSLVTYVSLSPSKSDT